VPECLLSEPELFSCCFRSLSLSSLTVPDSLLVYTKKGAWTGSQNHRMVWVGKDLKDLLAPTFRYGQGHLPLDHVAQRPIQPGLNSAREGTSTASLGRLCQCL